MLKNSRLILMMFFCILSTVQASAAERWGSWSPDVFARAAKENKFVILDLEAVWCHWCHVMEETTYHDPSVQKLLDEKYICVRADQEAFPDLAARYEEWGWPATIVFAADGTEIVKRRGYILPKVMASLLEAIIKDPSPGPSVKGELNGSLVGETFLSTQDKKSLMEDHDTIYDEKNGGWGSHYKLIDIPNMEYAFYKTWDHDAKEESRARRTLDLALNLLDPEWGGFFQYSDEVDWKSPHFEKIMPIESQYIRIYALAYATWKDIRYLKAAEKIFSFVKNFWTSPEGAFYTSQDADVAEDFLGKKFYHLSDKDRRSLGRMPKIDKHIYSRENGWMISGILSLYGVTGNPAYLEAARYSAQWIIANRSLPGGGFRHGEIDKGGPFLEDTLFMGRAFLDFYEVTADRRWLVKSEEAAHFIENNFKDQEAGYVMFKLVSAGGVFAKPIRQIEAEIALARFSNLLYQYTGLKEYRVMAEHTMKYLTSRALLDSRGGLTGVLVADRELSTEPAHLTILGPKKDEKAEKLYMTALSYPALYRRIEWWDRSEGDLPRGDVAYPELEKPAAFVCANQACSLPYFETEKLLKAFKSK